MKMAPQTHPTGRLHRLVPSQQRPVGSAVGVDPV